MPVTSRFRSFLAMGTAAVWALLSISFHQSAARSAEPASGETTPPYPNTFFDADPNHPWNQLYGLFFIRRGVDGSLYGLNEMDPLYWVSSRYLLEKPLHEAALHALDNFIQSDAVYAIKDPLKRALLQRMLWVLFDTWASHSDDGAPPPYETFAVERRQLEVRVAKVMKAIALAGDEISALPDNYKLAVAAQTFPASFDPAQEDRPFLPDSFFAGTDWVDLDGTNYNSLAPVHVGNVKSRSGFHVLISLPAGRSEMLAYLKRLHDFQPHWIYDWDKMALVSEPFVMRSQPPWANPELPQVPLLTKFALIRRALLIDNKGEVKSSPLTESIQLRVIRSIEPSHSSGGEQSFALFTLDQTKLMAGAGGLTPTGKTDPGFDMVFGGAGMDPLADSHPRHPTPAFPREYRLASCQNCHGAPGIFSMNSYIQFFQNNRTLQPPDLRPGDDADWSAEVSKRSDYTWGLLQAYWFGAN